MGLMAKTPDTAAPKRSPWIAPEGVPIILGIAIATLAVSAALWLVSWWGGAAALVAGTIITLWSVWFFRDPDRATPGESSAVTSAADGVVCFIGPGSPPPELGVRDTDAQGMTRVSIFMNIFDVHVNRAPFRGRVERMAYKAGKFFNASLDKASEHNERLSLLMRLPDGRAIAVVQIAGLIARRIVCRVPEGRELERGERFGLIRFGSRVDHYLPPRTTLLVSLGDRTVAGSTVIAKLAEAGSESAP